MSDSAPSYKRHRFPPAVIAHAVWLYLRFSLSLRAVEEMLLERGVEVSHETLRRWVAKFGPAIARGLRRRQARSGRVWHLDEVQVSIRGQRFWLWRAVDEHGVVLEEILQPRRDRKAAKRLLRRLLKDRRPSAEADRDRQVGLVRGGEARGRARPRAPGAQGAEQPCREQPSAVPIARAADAGPPLSGWAAALRLHALGRAQPASSPPLAAAAPLKPPDTTASRPSTSGVKPPASPAEPRISQRPSSLLG